MDCTLLLGQIVQTTKESAHRAVVAEAETNRISTHGISPALKEKVCVCVCVCVFTAGCQLYHHDHHGDGNGDGDG